MNFASRLTRACRLLVLLLAAPSGCAPLFEHLSFPETPLHRTNSGVFYDTNGQGKANFAILADESGKFDILAYDDTGNGNFNRTYRLSDYRNEDVPHLVILLDSIPYQSLVDRMKAGDFYWFDQPPQKVIPPFPSLTEQIFTKIAGAPPLPGMTADFYDTHTNTGQWGIARRIAGYEPPWEKRCDYDLTFYNSLHSYIRPSDWYKAELARAKKAFDNCPNRVCIVYFTSTSGLLSKYGQAGAVESLEGVQRLCLQALYERQGAVKISICADHGHNLVRSKNFSLDPYLKEAGFKVSGWLGGPQDVVTDMDGLLTYIGLHTHQPAAVSDALVKHEQIEFCTYLDKHEVVIRSAKGVAAIECHAGNLRYTPTTTDVLNYQPVIDALKAANKLDAQGYASPEDWFSATLNHEYPDAPKRLWDAFHGMTVNPPDVMLQIRDGWCVGPTALELFITMASTHGSLNQINSATFVMSTTGRVTGPMRSKDIMNTIEPGYQLPLRH